MFYDERRELQKIIYIDFVSLKDILNNLKMGGNAENDKIWNDASFYHDFLSDYYIDIAIDILFYKIKNTIDYFNKCDNKAYEWLKNVINEIDDHIKGLPDFYMYESED